MSTINMNSASITAQSKQTPTIGLKATTGTTGTGSTSSSSGTSSTSSTTSDPGVSATNSSNTSSDQQDRFLQLLVAQMNNQDPLNPMDNSAVTSQMAQISTVEGIENLNSTLSKYTASQSSTSAAAASNLIGQNVLSAGTSLTWGSGTTHMQAGVSIDQPATQVSVQLLDSSGTVVDQKTFTNQTAGTISVDWTGKDASGTSYGAGSYTMRASAMGDNSVTAKPLTMSTVQGVVQGTSGVTAQLANGSSVATTDIQGVFRP